MPMISPIWTDEAVTVLRVLWDKDYPASAIAERIPGATRSAVLGKVHRLGLSERRTVRPPGSLPKPRARKIRIAKPRRERPAVAPEIAAEILELPADQSLDAVSFMDVKDGQCRWPIGEPSNLDTFRFCGTAQIEGCSYCQRHAFWSVNSKRERSEAQREIARRRSRKSFRNGLEASAGGYDRGGGRDTAHRGA